MRTRFPLFSLSCLCLLAISAQAQDSTFDPVERYRLYEDVYSMEVEPIREFELFKGEELYLDVFFAAADFRNTDYRYGGGLGAGYFFCRNFAWHAEAVAFGETGHDFNVFTGGVLRLPIDYAALALYGIAGGGYEFGNSDQWNLQIGGGIDIRLLDHASTFVDARYVEPDEGDSGAAFRVGMRFLF